MNNFQQHVWPVSDRITQTASKSKICIHTHKKARISLSPSAPDVKDTIQAPAPYGSILSRCAIKASTADDLQESLRT